MKPSSRSTPSHKGRRSGCIGTTLRFSYSTCAARNVRCLKGDGSFPGSSDRSNPLNPMTESDSEYMDLPSAPGACPQCGDTLPADAPEGLCPRCMFAGIPTEEAPVFNDEEATLPLTTGPGTGLAPAGDSVGPGGTIGPFRLLEKLGEGGFGVVWKAEQTHPLKRTVALKLIKPGFDSEEIVARFALERQALAVMDHPHIARVYDAGTAGDGRPYFGMEWVDGRPLTRFCDEERLSIRERLELFELVCHAVQHAHQKGVIHRDLKPSNVLVTKDDQGRAVPKVIDFGIAKALVPDLAEIKFTHSLHVIGTPVYMSPEQAVGATDIDTRSDLYSLGVILYELLTGEPPLDQKVLMRRALDEILHLIREEEPKKPSTRIGTLEQETQARVAEARGTATGKLLVQVRGDLDWIVLKSLSKERERRYGSATAFGEDIRRHLDGNPVEAAPPDAGYRLRKFVGRNRLLVVSSATVALLLAIGVIVTIRQNAIISDARDQEAALRALSEEREGEVKRTLANSDFNQASEFLEAGRSSEALGHMARALRLDPTNQNALIRALNLLMERNWPHLSSKEESDSSRPSSDAIPEIINRRIETLDGGTYQATFHLKEKSTKSYGGYYRYDYSEWDKNIYLFEKDLENFCKTEVDDAEMPIAYSGDGRWVAIPGQASAVLVDRRDGKRMRAPNHDGRVSCLAFSPDGRLIATGANDNFVRIWDIENQELFAEPIDHQEWIDRLGFSSDGRALVVTTRSGNTFWDLSDRRRLNFTWERGRTPENPTDFEWNQGSGKPLVALIQRSSVGVINYSEGREISQIRPGTRENSTTNGHWDPRRDGRWVRFVDSGAAVVDFNGGKLFKWDVESAKPVAEIRSEKPWSAISPLKSPRSTWILAPEDGKRTVLAVIDSASLRVKCRIHSEPSDSFETAMFVEGGNVILTHSVAGFFALFDTATGAPRSEPFRIEGGRLVAAGTSRESLLILIARTENKKSGIEVIDARSGIPVGSWTEHSFQSGLDHSMEQGIFASAKGDELTVFEFSGRRRFSVREPDFFGEVRFIGRGERIMTIPDRDGFCKFFDSATGFRFPPEFRTSQMDYGVPSISSNGGFAIYEGRLLSIESGRILTDSLVRMREPESGCGFAPIEKGTLIWTVGGRVEAFAGRGDEKQKKEMIEFVPVLRPGELVAPSWFPDLLEGLGGARVEKSGSFSMPMSKGRNQLIERIRDAVRKADAAAMQDPVFQTMHWWIEKREERPINPFSEMTLEAWRELRIRQNTVEGWREILGAYRSDPKIWERYSEVVAAYDQVEAKRAEVVSKLLRRDAN